MGGHGNNGNVFIVFPLILFLGFVLEVTVMVQNNVQSLGRESSWLWQVVARRQACSRCRTEASFRDVFVERPALKAAVRAPARSLARRRLCSCCRPPRWRCAGAAAAPLRQVAGRARGRAHARGGGAGAGAGAAGAPRARSAAPPPSPAALGPGPGRPWRSRARRSPTSGCCSSWNRRRRLLRQSCPGGGRRVREPPPAEPCGSMGSRGSRRWRIRRTQGPRGMERTSLSCGRRVGAAGGERGPPGTRSGAPPQVRPGAAALGGTRGERPGPAVRVGLSCCAWGGRPLPCSVRPVRLQKYLSGLKYVRCAVSDVSVSVRGTGVLTSLDVWAH